MRIHRFYVSDTLDLTHDFWVHDAALLWQWNKVLRFKVGQQLILFDGQDKDRLYKIADISKAEAHLQLVTDMERVLPRRHVYLLWSLLKKDNNDHILQKCTELGVSNFVPILSERSVRTNFNIDRAHKIIIEASEQCGRSDIPTVREPMHLEKALEQYRDHVEFIVCEQTEEPEITLDDAKRYALLIGPEGGWSEAEKELFKANNFLHMSISNHVLRAETAAVVAASKLL